MTLYDKRFARTSSSLDEDRELTFPARLSGERVLTSGLISLA